MNVIMSVSSDKSDIRQSVSCTNITFGVKLKSWLKNNMLFLIMSFKFSEYEITNEFKNCNL